MKDIVNPKVREALERLDRAIARLDSVAQAQGNSAEAAGLKEELAHLTKQHAALKGVAGRTAERLDVVIGRVQAALEG